MSNEVVVVDALKAYLNSITGHSFLSAEEEKSLSERIQKDKNDQEAINTLVNHNLLLVVSVAKRFYGCGMPLIDLIQEGNIGLMNAAKKYDGSRGFRFSTYATYWIRQAISRSLSKQSYTIHLPQYMVELLAKVKKAQSELTQKMNRQPTEEEIAEYIGAELEKVQTVMDMSQSTLSLETPVGDDEDASMADMIADVDSSNPETRMMQEATKTIVAQVLDTLGEREAEILRMRFGINRDRGMTLEEVGQHYGVTKERIRQIESKAIRKLRNPVRARVLKEAY